MRLGGLRRGSHHPQAGELVDEGGLQALGLAIEDALEEGSVRSVAQALPERLRARAGDERAGGLRGFEIVAIDPVGGPG
jgi:hypothetical protein